MSFSFNFTINNDSSGAECVQEPKYVTDINIPTDGALTERGSRPAEGLQVNWLKLAGDRPTEQVPLTDDFSLTVISSSSVESDLGSRHDPVTENTDQSDVSKALAAESDLLPNVYEGGMKIWECSVDLVRYLSSLEIAFRGCSVLELGCGAGLPGLYAYTQGAHVTFQDYNAEVLSLITAPNILLNHGSQDGCHPTQCRLVAGDWTAVQDMMSQENLQFDYILTSETIYSPESFKKLHDVMRATIKPAGTIYLAAKTYYFGVGGGTRDFEQLLDREGVFNHTVCKQLTEGVHREVLKLTLKPS